MKNTKNKNYDELHKKVIASLMQKGMSKQKAEKTIFELKKSIINQI